jgi:hypothetical protein
VEVLNFSLAAVLSAKGVLIPTSPLLPSSARDKLGTLSTSSTIYAGEVPFLRNEVETHLPYVSYKRDLKQTHAEYMIHADGIVGVNVRSDSSLLCCSAQRRPRLPLGLWISFLHFSVLFTLR